MRSRIINWSLALVAVLLLPQVSKAQIAASNPLEWIALAEGNELINGQIEKQIKGQTQTALLQNSIAAEFNRIHEWQKQYNGYLKTVNGYASSLKACTHLYNDGVRIFLTLGKLGKAIKDNPQAILLRDGKSVEYPTQELMVGDKRILESRLTLQSGDVFLLMTDGVTHAGLGNLIPDGWQREGVLQYVEEIYTPDLSAKNLAARVADACRDLYLERIDDDVTVAVFKMRTRQAVNLLVGPPRQHEDDEAFMHRFFASEGTHIVCGGSTAQMVSRYLGRQLIISEDYVDPDIPPVAKIRGIDLVTEGIVTLSRVLEISSRYASSQSIPSHWDTRSDAATQIARVLLEDATDIHFFVGRAVNPSHQSPSLHIDFSLKMSIIEKLEKILREMGKRVTVEYC